MRKDSKLETYNGLLISFAILGLAVALIVLPNQFSSEAGNDKTGNKGLLVRTESHTDELKNYDIREDKNEETANNLLKFRHESGKTGLAIANTKADFVRGEEDLRTRVSTLKVEYNQDIGIPEVISPDAWKADIEHLTAPSREKNSETLRNFIKQNNLLVGMENYQIDQLKVLSDYTNPAGNMSFAHLEQRINGIPVFRGEVKAGFTINGEMLRVINNLAPGLDYESLSTDFDDPLNAVKAAARHINHEFGKADLVRNNALSDDLEVVFGKGVSATTAEKMYFPTEVGVARPAWRVLIWQPVSAYYVIVDAKTGTMLWRKNITEDQTQSATYSVYTNSDAMINVARSPYVWAPGPTMPTEANAATPIPRTSITRIGNEAPYNFNNLGWITDGANGTNGWTDGNSTEAGVDLVSPDGIDAPTNGTGRVFDFSYNPYNPNDGTGDSPTGAAARDGGVVQLFYICNWYHDELYRLGFTEPAFNFQNDNFGRGGAGGDRVRCESQDSSGTNNANMSTPADGGRGRMQMYRWTLAGPGLDGSLDADIVIHEFTHGLSNRLHGNSSGLSANMSRMMGEGWSDFYSHALLSQESDPANGIYTLSGWATSGLLPGLSSYYYGIRRFPKAPMAFTGGPNNLPHNPITFADVDNTTDSYDDGAFPAPVAPHLSSTADQVHTGGEVWSSALWEVRTLMVARLGWADGNRRALQVVTDGMKLAPLNPNYLQERDAIITAATVFGQDDAADVREGFRIRGMGFSAQVITAGTGGGTARVQEAFDFPNVQHIDPFSVSDASGDGDGFPEPGENVTMNVPVTNATGATITNVVANISGGTSVAYGNISDGQTVTMQIPYTVPGGEACGSFHTVQVNVSSDAGTQAPVDRTFRLGSPVGGPPTTFENTATITVPATGTSGPATPYPSTINVSGLSGNKIIKVELTDVAHTWVDDIDVMLEGPGGQAYIFMGDAFGNTDANATTFTISDGGADGPLPDGGPLATGDYQPGNYTPTDTFDAPAPAPTGDAASGDTFISVFGMDGSTMNGEWKLWIDDDAGSDSGTIGGWKITFESDDYACSLAPQTPRADFDGDGRTDMSVFRPSEGNWYINGSTDGFFAMNWGISTDTLVPGDFDGDGKADYAVFRPSDAEGTPDFFILNSNGFVVSGAEWGSTGDVPVVSDYDGDGKDDIAVFRDSDATWYILNTGGGITVTPHGATGDTPIVGDFDGDNVADLTYYRNGDWVTTGSAGGGTTTVNHGIPGDIIAPGDFDGDGTTDEAMFRPSNGTWYILMSSGSGETTFVPFGGSGDIPVPGDYDGDGKDDFALYRGGTWWVLSSQSSSTSSTNFGLATDAPIPSRANP